MLNGKPVIHNLNLAANLWRVSVQRNMAVFSSKKIITETQSRNIKLTENTAFPTEIGTLQGPFSALPEHSLYYLIFLHILK